VTATTTVRPTPRGAGPGGRRRSRLAGRRAQRALRPWLLLTPALAVLALLLLYPLIRVGALSFQDYGLRQVVSGESNWTGLENYRELLTDGYLWRTALPNTVVFAVVNVALTVAVGTLVALLLHRLAPRLRAVVTTAVMMAWAVPAVTGTYVWVFVFDPRDGVATRVLDALGVIDAGTTNWFTDRLAFYAIATLNVVHHGFPFVALTVLAGLMTIPKELVEAAVIDGATAWRRFWSVTVPMLKPVFAVVTILSTIWDFKVFTQVYLMPGGDGGNREVLNMGTWSYVQSFAQNRYGLGSAVAVLLTLVLLAITAVYLKLLFSEDEL
jgi:N,N'-diacetylchitobiose transport system permease protein